MRKHRDRCVHRTAQGHSPASIRSKPRTLVHVYVQSLAGAPRHAIRLAFGADAGALCGGLLFPVMLISNSESPQLFVLNGDVEPPDQMRLAPATCALAIAYMIVRMDMVAGDAARYSSGHEANSAALESVSGQLTSSTSRVP
jgi:hypothetical protein